MCKAQLFEKLLAGIVKTKNIANESIHSCLEYHRPVNMHEVPI